jgi:uncharacterized protein involved in response to NO
MTMPGPLPVLNKQMDPSIPQILARERQKSLMLRAWIVAGLFYMALPGTLLGFSNLMAISAHHGLATLSPAWIQGHGHAQMFGWIGSFILGIGFYSQSAKGRSPLRLPLACFVFWTTGVALRWLANIYGWHWRILLPLSAVMELVAICLSLKSARRHKLPVPVDHPERKSKIPLWMTSVLIGTTGLAFGVLFNFVECVRLAIAGASPSFPHGLDQRYLVLLGWGFLVPFVWGFSARWLPAFLGVPQPRQALFKAALWINLAGIIFGLAGLAIPASVLLALGAVLVARALHLVGRPSGHAKIQGIHPSFPVFVRLSYLWLTIAGAMSIWAACADAHGGIWGAARHALTVGFAANMVFSIGPRILPHFSGVRALFSARLMLLSLLLLQIGCTLRVASEPLAYEGFLSFAWKTLPISGMLELSGVLVFALNIGLTVLAGKSASIEAPLATA